MVKTVCQENPYHCRYKHLEIENSNKPPVCDPLTGEKGIPWNP